MTTNRTRKKTRRRRVHKGRLAIVIIFALAIGFGIAGIVYLLCSNNSIDESPREIIAAAVEAGRADALSAANAAPESMERDEALLFIKARESQLRRNGYSHAADDYISTAQHILVEKGVIKKK